jgi:hypothetical protein
MLLQFVVYAVGSNDRHMRRDFSARGTGCSAGAGGAIPVLGSISGSCACTVARIHDVHPRLVC